MLFLLLNCESDVLFYFQIRPSDLLCHRYYQRARITTVGAYLMKLRTGDSDDRIATLLGISRSTLTKYVMKARSMMEEHFVPAHLGLQHISREEVAQRNLYVPVSFREARKRFTTKKGYCHHGWYIHTFMCKKVAIIHTKKKLIPYTNIGISLNHLWYFVVMATSLMYWAHI